jgi:AraC-like DNA-binding protein
MTATKVQAYAAQSSSSALALFSITRREPGPLDVEIEILYCGVCHSDIDLDQPFVTHNEELLKAIGAQLETELQERNASTDVGDQVKHTLKRSLAGKRPTLPHIARELGMSVRTLQRRLTDARMNFQQLVEDTRRELARHYLKHSAVELNEAAFLLGYEDANSFFRAFHLWEGTSPGEWREQHRARGLEVSAR